MACVSACHPFDNHSAPAPRKQFRVVVQPRLPSWPARVLAAIVRSTVCVTTGHARRAFSEATSCYNPPSTPARRSTFESRRTADALRALFRRRAHEESPYTFSNSTPRYRGMTKLAQVCYVSRYPDRPAQRSLPRSALGRPTQTWRRLPSSIQCVGGALINGRAIQRGPRHRERKAVFLGNAAHQVQRPGGSARRDVD